MKRFGILVGKADQKAIAEFNTVGQIERYLEKTARLSGCSHVLYILDTQSEKLWKVDINVLPYAFGWCVPVSSWIEDSKGNNMKTAWSISL